eukprot:262641-Hanusia_phi.AAC.2
MVMQSSYISYNPHFIFPSSSPSLPNALWRPLALQAVGHKVADLVLGALPDALVEQPRVVDLEDAGLQGVVVDPVAVVRHAEADGDGIAGEVVDVDHPVGVGAVLAPAEGQEEPALGH